MEAIGSWRWRSVKRGVELGGTGDRSQLDSWRNRPTIRSRAALKPKSPLNLCHSASSSSSSSSRRAAVVVDVGLRSEWLCRPPYHSGSDAVADGLEQTICYYRIDTLWSRLRVISYFKSKCVQSVINIYTVGHKKVPLLFLR